MQKQTWLIGVYLFLSGGSLLAQTDTSSEMFFPHSVGNVWQYAFQGGGTGTATLTRDSVAGSTTYLFYNNDPIPAFSIDTSLNVVYYPTFPPWRRLRYKLNANLMEWWTVESEDTTIGRPAVIARVESTFWGYLFGVPTQMKAIGFYIDQGDTSILFWRNVEYLAAGFGFFLSFYDPPWAPSEELIGCIIDGRRYGTLVSVNERSQSSTMLSSHRLYPCFPNPFNPSTNISYSLTEATHVNVSVYDLLGRLITNLVNEYQAVGSHSVTFQPQSLSSGVYFVRFTARDFIATNAIVYSK